MSADADFSLRASDLVAHGTRVEACDHFRVRAGESRHHCDECQQGLLAHVVVAQRARMRQCCGSCQHSNDAETIHDGETHCTLAGGFYNGKLMQFSARCSAWAKP